jgi:CRP-like cAMP-binding protein
METRLNNHLKNHILANLTDAEYQRILPHLENVDLSSGTIIYELGQPIDYLYFPLGSMISLVTQMEDGKIVEVGLVGSDGMSGISAFLGQKTSPDRAFIQIPNGAARVKVEVIRTEFDRAEGVQKLLLRYAYVLMRQVSQTAACNASHTAEERLSRWLLMCRDRVQSDDLKLTQEFLAEMLGTRRATVNAAAVTLQSAGFINYNRGHIRIIDNAGLASFSCECYEALRKATNNVSEK